MIKQTTKIMFALIVCLLTISFVQSSALSIFYFNSNGGTSLTVTDGDLVDLFISGDGIFEASITMVLYVDDVEVLSITEYDSDPFPFPSYMGLYELGPISYGGVGTHTLKLTTTGISGTSDTKELTLVVNAAPILGCTDSTANNYDSTAIQDDDSCTYDPAPIPGCTDSTANNYDSTATEDDDSCTYDVAPIPGCTDNTANNYDATATQDDGTCTYDPIPGCTDSTANNYDSTATQDDGTCTYDAPADTTAPTVTIISPVSATHISHVTVIVFNTYDSVGVSSCQYSLDGGTTKVDTSCSAAVTGITSTTGTNNWIVYATDAAGNTGERSITFSVVIPGSPVLGCTDNTANNYDATATEDDGTCTYDAGQVPGCTDSTANNYDSTATQDDGTCTYDVASILGCTDNEANNYDSTATQDDSSCTYDSTTSTKSSKSSRPPQNIGDPIVFIPKVSNEPLIPTNKIIYLAPNQSTQSIGPIESITIFLEWIGGAVKGIWDFFKNLFV